MTQKAPAKTITVSEDDDGQRLDRWLKKKLKLPHPLIQKIIRKGEVRIDGKRAKTDTRLKAGQDVRIPPLEPAEIRNDPKKPLTAEERAFIKSLIIFQDKDVIVLNKPAGIAVQGGSKTTRHLDRLLPALAGRDGIAPRLVHRLDKETSGLLLLARSAKSAKILGDAFKTRKPKKIYWALVAPTPSIHEGTIKAPLVKAGGKNKERMHVDEKEGKFALTDYAVLDHAHNKVAFVAFKPQTGRTHQIRAHAELLGSPILGDRKYGREIEPPEGLSYANRLHLHARRLKLPHPSNNTMLDITAPLPDDLKNSWKAFGFDPQLKDDSFTD